MINNSTPKTNVGTIEISDIQTETPLNVPSFAKIVSQFFGKNTSQLLEIIFAGAIDLDTSDIHFETEEKQVKVRLRIDGVLQDLANVARPEYQRLLSRLKLNSGIKLNISDRPQDGRFSIIKNNENIEVRTSTLPSEHGESIVLRILNPKSLISLEQLGLREDLLKIFRREINKPNGMIIVTGPTGSGKTTTLYAFLKEVEDPTIKIITIEDPIEYHLQGISQTQVEPAKGYDFASGLRAIVRQDPDVILVGEIRDLETAEIALQAALTGHLVFSTIHANDAAATIARLVDLGANLPSTASAINLIIAQRLARKVCPKCAKFKALSAAEAKLVSQQLSKIPAVKITAQTKIPVAQGCEDCGMTGYRGRLGVFEALLIDEEMERFILSNPPTSSLKNKAMEKGMVTMYQDGLIRVLDGLTTIAELDRMVGAD